MSEAATLRIGVLGGTFDPIHYGHLVAAEETCYALKLDRVLFVPAGDPPHKSSCVVSSIAHRVAMVELAIAGNELFALSRIDVDRPGPSYSVDMLAELRRALGAEIELHFIIGVDSLAELVTWHEPARIVQLCHIAAVSRPGYATADLPALERAIPGVLRRLSIIDIPGFDVSSTNLRQRVAQGRPIRYQLPEAVERYIYRQGLYRRE